MSVAKLMPNSFCHHEIIHNRMKMHSPLFFPRIAEFSEVLSFFFTAGNSHLFIQLIKKYTAVQTLKMTCICMYDFDS